MKRTDDPEQYARQRAYWRGRAAVKKAAMNGTRYQVDRMDTERIHQHLISCLLEVEDYLSGKADPDVYAASQMALACYLELHLRGQQLQLNC